MRRIKTLGATVSLLLAQALSAQTQIITTVAGTGWTFPSTALQAANAPLGKVNGVAIDAKGNIYISDSGNLMVMKFTPGGALTVVAGNGVEGFAGDGGPAVNAALSAPTDVAVDANGNLFIIDGARIRKVSTAGVITTVAGNGILGFSPDGPATGVSIDPLAGIAVDAGGNVYFNDTFNNVVRKITNGTIATIVGTGKAGAADTGSALQVTLNNPSGLMLDSSGDIDISDSLNHRVLMVNSKGTVTNIAGTGSSGAAGDGGPAVSANLEYPAGLALDSKGNLYISDDDANNVRMVNSGLQTINTIAGNGKQGFSGDGGAAAKAMFSTPFGMAADLGGNVYVADSGNFRIRELVNAAAAAPTIATVAGNATFRFGGDGFPAIDAELNFPAGLAFDSNGTIYIADTDNNRIRSINTSGNIGTIAGNGFAALVDGSALNASFSAPTGIAVDSGLNVYVADTGNNVIRKIAPGGTVSTVAGGGTNPFNENIQATTTAIGTPTGVAVDSTGNLYVVASGTGRVFKVNTDGSIHSFAGFGNGNVGFSGDGGPATSATFSTPLDVALDSAGNAYIADSQNFRIRKVTAGTNGVITTIAGNGSPTDVDGGQATASGVFLPYAVAIDKSNNLYIAEFGGRIREVNLSTGIIQTVAGKGSPNVPGDGGSAVNAGINEPEAVAVNPSGSLFIGDTGNGRIREVIAAGPASTTTPPPAGQPAPVQIAFQVAPLNLTFAGNNANGPSAPQIISLTASVPGLNYTASGNAPWLSVTPASGTMPGSVQITANPSGMAAGTYQGLVTVTASAAVTPAITVTVTFNVTAATPPALGVDTQSVTLTATQGSSAVSQQIHVQDTGGGTAPFTVTTSAGGGTWLGVSVASGTASPSSPVAVNITATPGNLAVGTYSGSVTVTGAGSSIAVPVTLTISPSTAVILVSQSGMTFTAVAQGGSPLPQSFGILNVGSGTMSWSASSHTLSGGSWLQISPTSGTVQTPYLDVSLVNVSINPASLGSGTYYGQIQVASLATNTPQLITVILTVLPTGFSLGPQVYPTGLIFTGVAGVTPSSQNVSVGNPAGTSNSYQSGIIGAGFSFAPTNAVLQATQPSTLHVYPDFSSLNPGSIQQGTITLQFSDRSPSQTVNVLVVVAPPGVTLNNAQPDGDIGERNHAYAAEPRATTACAPLQIQYTSVQGSVTATLGQGTALEVKVTDNCGNLVGPGGENAQVTAYFSSNDTVNMTHIGNGIWQGTWRPVTTGTFVVAVIAKLLQGGSIVGGTSASLNCVVNSASAAGTTSGTPITTPQAVVQAASDAGGAPIAPGELITIYGNNLVDGTSVATTLPLPMQVGTTTVMLGNQPLPIQIAYVGTSYQQLNVQVPYTVPVNTQYQLSVQHGVTLSVPTTLVVAEAVPGIFTVNEAGTGQGVIEKSDGITLAQSGTPAAIGEEVVIYCTGLGAVNGNVTAGTPPPAATTVNTPTVMIGGQQAQVAYSGLTPGFPGLYQINAYVPSGIVTGNAVPVTITMAGQTSSTVTMAVQ